MHYSKIIDISQPVSSTSACFPGDVPFSKNVTVSFKDSNVINLTSLTMSPHVGTHVDAPSHIKGDMTEGNDLAAGLPLEPFVGPVIVLDLAPHCGGITWEQVQPLVENVSFLPARVLFRTQNAIKYDVFESDFSFFTPELVSELSRRGVCLMGIDTPSVDHSTSKTMDAHHCLDKYAMVWIENLDLTKVEAGQYFLVSLPLKFTELEASPVRAVLLV